MGDETDFSEEMHNAIDSSVGEEVLQIVSAQALRMARVEDTVAELKGRAELIQKGIEQLGSKEAASPTPAAAAPRSDSAVLDHLDALEAAGKRAAKRSSLILAVGAAQMLLVLGWLGFSYMRMPQVEPPPVVSLPPPSPKLAIDPPPAAALAPAIGPTVVAPEPIGNSQNDDKSGRHSAKGRHKK